MRERKRGRRREESQTIKESIMNNINPQKSFSINFFARYIINHFIIIK